MTQIVWTQLKDDEIIAKGDINCAGNPNLATSANDDDEDCGMFFAKSYQVGRTVGLAYPDVSVGTGEVG